MSGKVMSGGGILTGPVINDHTVDFGKSNVTALQYQAKLLFLFHWFT
jgi:hypothetical protein